MFKVNCSASYESQRCVVAISAADPQAPIFLSVRENSDYVTSVELQTSVNKKLDTDILQLMMPDGTHPTYADTTGSEKMLYRDIQRLIIQVDTFNDEDELSHIYDMQQFNICGNNETRNVDMYWKAATRKMETESAHVVYERRHAAGDFDATNRISHAPFISTNNLVKITIQIL